MRKYPYFQSNGARITASVLSACFATWLLLWTPFSPVTPISDPAYLSVESGSSATLPFFLHLDGGHDMPSVTPMLRGSFAQGDSKFQRVVTLPAGQIRSLKFAIRASSDLTLGRARVVTQSGRVLADFSCEAIEDLHNTLIQKSVPFLKIRAADPSDWCAVRITPPVPLVIPTGNEPKPAPVFFVFVIAFLAGLATLSWLETSNSTLVSACSGALRKLQSAALIHPVRAILLASICGSLTANFPVVFFNRTMVSPNLFQTLIYPTQFTLPDTPKEEWDETLGSDIGAFVHQQLGYSVVERNAFFRSHTIPYWNRYSACGVSLIGQNQSMIGDPLNLLTVLLGATGRAWDLKFILAKTLFCFGIGLCTWVLTVDLFSSALIALSVSWIGYFGYRYNHCAIFSVCYAPWILFSWIHLIRAAHRGQSRTLWIACLIGADIWVLNSGTAKEASSTMLFTNFAGVCLAVLQSSDWPVRLRTAALGVWANILFLLIAAPFWVLFLDELARSASSYEKVDALQLSPTLAPGFFDGLFTQDLATLEFHVNPSLNFLIFSGLAFWIAASRRGRLDRSALALALAGFPALLAVFGVIPRSIFESLPFLKSIKHIFNTFGCALLVLLPVLAGFGFRAIRRSSRIIVKSSWSRVCLATGVVLAIYFGYTSSLLGYTDVPEPLGSGMLSPFVPLYAHLSSIFFVHYIPALLLCFAVLPWAVHWTGVEGVRLSGYASLFVCFVILHFTKGCYLSTKFDHYVMNPRTSANLEAPSPAVEFVKKRMVEPARVSGFEETLNAGYEPVVGLEAIAGSDALFNRWLRELVNAAHVNMSDNLWTVAPEESSFPRLKPLWEMLNIRYYLRPLNARPPIPDGVKQAGALDLEVLEDENAWPRAFFTDEVVTYRTPEELLQIMARSDGKPFAALQRPGEPSFPSPTRTIAPAYNYDLGVNRTSFTIDAPAPGLAILTEAFESDNFIATVDGVPVPYDRVNHAFKAAPISTPGSHRVEFVYEPKCLAPALIASVIGLIGLLGTFVFERRLRSRATA